MTKVKKLFYCSLAIGSMVAFAPFAQAQHCSSCTSGGSFGTSVVQPTVAAPVNSSCGCNTGGCKGCALGSRFHELQARHQHAQYINSMIAARNDAWPKPFNCADRQLYFSIWEPMIDRGFEEQCVLTEAHFDEQNQLNRFGKHAVAGIMQNMPSNRRQVFIHRSVDDRINQTRLANVEDIVNTFYGQMGAANVAFSTRLPVNIRGSQAEQISKKWLEGMQTPVIPISSGEDVSSAVGGG